MRVATIKSAASSAVEKTKTIAYMGGDKVVNAFKFCGNNIVKTANLIVNFIRSFTQNHLPYYLKVVGDWAKASTSYVWQHKLSLTAATVIGGVIAYLGSKIFSNPTKPVGEE
jgi:hypothetical protein